MVYTSPSSLIPFFFEGGVGSGLFLDGSPSSLFPLFLVGGAGSVLLLDCLSPVSVGDNLSSPCKPESCLTGEYRSLVPGWRAFGLDVALCFSLRIFCSLSHS